MTFEEFNKKLTEVEIEGIKINHPKLAIVRPQIERSRSEAKEVWSTKMLGSFDAGSHARNALIGHHLASMYLPWVTEEAGNKWVRRHQRRFQTPPAGGEQASPA